MEVVIAQQFDKLAVILPTFASVPITLLRVHVNLRVKVFHVKPIEINKLLTSIDLCSID